jgi:hypothetical protein
VLGSPQFTAKAELAFVREAQKICALRKYQLLEKISGSVLGEMFGLGLIGVTGHMTELKRPPARVAFLILWLNSPVNEVRVLPAGVLLLTHYCVFLHLEQTAIM